MSQKQKVGPLRDRLLVGSVWMVGLRWSLDLAGFCSTLVLARLLAPADFGLLSMVMVVVALTRVLFELGTDYALIERSDVTPDHYHAAWTLRVAQGVLAAAVIALLAEPASVFFDDPRVRLVAHILAVGVFIKSLVNIGVVDFRKYLHFRKEFWLLISVKLLTIPVTLAMAFWLRSYWALVIGIVVGYVLEVVLSYVMHSFRPRFSLRLIADIWMFSKWMVVVQIANGIALHIDRLFLGRVTTPHEVGLYTLAGEIATLPHANIVAPLSRSLTPGFAQLKGEAERLNTAFLKAIAATSLIGIPAGVGVALVAEEAVAVMLGTQWQGAEVFLRILALNAVAMTVLSTSINLLMVTGEIRSVGYAACVRALAFVLAAYPGFILAGIAGVAAVKVCASLLAVVLVWHKIVAARRVRWIALWGQVWRPLVASEVKVVVVWQLHGWWSHSIVIALGAKIVVGAGVYALGVLTLWRLTGSRYDVEGDLLQGLKNLARFLPARRAKEPTSTPDL